MKVLVPLLVCGCLWVTGCKEKPVDAIPAPPVMVATAPFELVNQRGEAFRSESLKGRPYVANFFFSHCATICPSMMDTLADARAKAQQAGAVLPAVSITIDPENDTPKRLAEYAKSRGITDPDWHLLTGPEDDVMDVVTKGYRAYAQPISERSEGITDIGHEGRIFLIDSQGRLRGFYDADPVGMDALIRDFSIISG